MFKGAQQLCLLHIEKQILDGHDKIHKCGPLIWPLEERKKEREALTGIVLTDNSFNSQNVLTISIKLCIPHASSCS